MTGGVGNIFGLTQKVLPFTARQPAMIEIRPRPFAPVIEETDVVISLLERLDLALDKAIKLRQISNQIIRQRKIQRGTPDGPSRASFVSTLCDVFGATA